jgi:hypothetical protein
MKEQLVGLAFRLSSIYTELLPAVMRVLLLLDEIQLLLIDEVLPLLFDGIHPLLFDEVLLLLFDEVLLLLQEIGSLEAGPQGELAG